jgi:hypothetical protein
MPGEIQLNGASFASESGGTITVNNGTLSSSVVFPAGGAGNPISVAIIADQKASGTDGGTFSSGAWRTRDLNTEIADDDSIVSINSNQFTLAAGTYFINFRATAFRCDNHVAKLYNVTGSADIAFGMATQSADGDIATSVSEGACVHTITSNNTYEIQHRTNEGENTNGFGTPTNISVNNYTVVTIFKLK